MSVLTVKDNEAFENAINDPANAGKDLERICAELNIPPMLLGVMPPKDAKIGMSMEAAERQYLRSRGLMTESMRDELIAQHQYLESRGLI